MTHLAYRASAKGALLIFILCAALLACPSAALAQEVIRGLDYWVNPPGNDTSARAPSLGYFGDNSRRERQSGRLGRLLAPRSF